MKYEDENNALPTHVVIECYIRFIGCTIIIGYCLYALFLICRKKETWSNLYLLSMIFLTLVYAVCTIVFRIITLETQTRVHSYELYTLIEVCLIVSHWIF